MALRTTEAITLRTYPYMEADRIVVFFTRNYGQLRGIAKGARRIKSRFGSSLEPMTYVRAIFFLRENQELAFINSCDIIESHAPLRESLEGSYYCAYVAELLSEFSQEGEENEKMFRLALSVLGHAGSLSWDARARYLETWILRLDGVFPSLDCCSRCGRSLEDGPLFIPGGGQEALCGKCSRPRDIMLSAAGQELVRAIFSTKITEILWERWDRAALKNLGTLNYSLIQYNLEKVLKSQRFLKELNRC